MDKEISSSFPLLISISFHLKHLAFHASFSIFSHDVKVPLRSDFMRMKGEKMWGKDPTFFSAHTIFVRANHFDYLTVPCITH